MFSNVNHTLRIVIDTRGEPSLEEFFTILFALLIASLIFMFVALGIAKQSNQKQLNEEKHLPMEHCHGKIIDKQITDAGFGKFYDYIFDCGERGRIKLRAKANIHSELTDLLLGDEGVIRYYDGKLYGFMRNEKE